MKRVHQPKPRCRCYINAKYYAKVVGSGVGTLKGFQPCPIHDTDAIREQEQQKKDEATGDPAMTNTQLKRLPAAGGNDDTR